MRRLQLYMEQEWWDRLKKEKSNQGFTTVSSFIRFIIIRFFEKNKI